MEEEIARGLTTMLNHASCWESQSEAVETAKVVLEQSSRYGPGYTVTIFDTPRVSSPPSSSPVSSRRPPACHGCQVS